MQNLEHFVYEVALSEELLPSGTLESVSKKKYSHETVKRKLIYFSFRKLNGK